MAEKNLTDGTLALERKKPRVITIEATETPKDIKLRVAAYARVSTSSEDQLNSFAAQNRYYTSLISGKENWTLVDVYADEGITGTSAAKREDFQRMLADCRRGLIDHILCKSISRFARNTTECLELTRELKSIGVSVCFEEQNIDTMKVSGEILTSLFAAFAQAESESISKNLRWSYQRRMQAGEFITCKAAYGYKLKDGTLEISEPEASVVRNIFSLYLSGSGLDQIADLLAKSGIPTGNGKTVWNRAAVAYIIRNEKYIGDSMLQKSFTVDFLEKKMKPNEGEVPQYYVERSHPHIIEPDEWDHVQAEFARRKALGNTYSGKSTLSAKLVCEDCGSFYGSKVWHSTDKYRRTIWRCNNKFSNETHCCTPTLDTETVQELFITAYNRLMRDRRLLVEDCELMRTSLTDFALLDAQIEKAEEEANVVAELVNGLVRENASTAQSQDAYLRKYEALTQRYEAAKSELERLQKERTLRSQQDKAMALFIRTLKKQPEVLDAWDDTVWTVMVEKAIVHRDGTITFVFYNGTEIAVERQAA